MTAPRSVKSPSRVTVRVTPEGIVATNGRGHELRLPAAQPGDGFNPLELQSAALAICTAMTLRNELRNVLPPEQLQASLSVEGIKAADAPSRLGTLDITIELPHTVPADQVDGIIHRAEAACTIANTLRVAAEIVTRHQPEY